MKIGKYNKYLDTILLVRYMIASTILISGTVLFILLGTRLVGAEVVDAADAGESNDSNCTFFKPKALNPVFGHFEYTNSNLIDFGTMYQKNQMVLGHPDTADTESSTNSYVQIDSYNDFKFNPHFSFLSSFNYCNYSNSVYNETLDDTIKIKNQLTVTEARLKITDDYNNIYTIGILPMFHGITYRYDNFDFTRNDGSQYITGLILQGAEYTHRFEQSTGPLYLSLGFGWYEKWHVNSIELHNPIVRGSDGAFLYLKKIHNIDEYSKLEYNFEYSKIEYRYNEALAFSQHIIGNTLTYYDEANTIYGYFGYQFGYGDNTQLVRNQLQIPSYIPDQYLQQNTASTFIGEYNNVGSNLALGYKRLFDIGTSENFILGEYYKTFNNWVSPNIGEPFSNYGLGRLGEQYKLAFGHFFTTNCLLKLTYLNIHLDKTYKYGGSMQQTSIGSVDLSSKSGSQQVVLNFEILF